MVFVFFLKKAKKPDIFFAYCSSSYIGFWHMHYALRDEGAIFCSLFSVFGFHALEVNACFLSPDPCVFAKRRPCNTTCLC
jgi:hypothetical protein